MSKDHPIDIDNLANSSSDDDLDHDFRAEGIPGASSESRTGTKGIKRNVEELLMIVYVHGSVPKLPHPQSCPTTLLIQTLPFTFSWSTASKAPM